MKRVAEASEPPVVVPVVVVHVDIHIALVVVPPVERGEMYEVSPVPPPIDPPADGFSELNIIRYKNTLTLHTKYLLF